LLKTDAEGSNKHEDIRHWFQVSETVQIVLLFWIPLSVTTEFQMFDTFVLLKTDHWNNDLLQNKIEPFLCSIRRILEIFQCFQSYALIKNKLQEVYLDRDPPKIKLLLCFDKFY
jgi:hypothetical protein